MTHGMSRRAEGLLVLLLAIGTVVAPGSDRGAFAATVRDITTACPDGHVPDPGFTDTVTHAFEGEIACIAAYGVVVGATPTTYRPGDTVTRAQLATYLAGIFTAAGSMRPASLPDVFRDDDGGTHESNIDWLAHLGVVRGFADGTYRPADAVSRAQLATFLAGAVRIVTGQPLEATVDHFDDDDASPHRDSIDALAAAGVVTGTASRTYDPAGTLLRGQLAASVARTLDLFAADGHLQPPFGTDVLSMSPRTAQGRSVSDGPTSDTGQRTYTASIPIDVSAVTIALFPAENVIVSGGKTLFLASDVVPAGAGTSLEIVNGEPVTAAAPGKGTTQLSTVGPIGGLVTFAIDSVSARKVVPVVYIDHVEPSQGKLDIPVGASPSSPMEAMEQAVGGGEVAWDPAAPVSGMDVPVGTVQEVDLSGRSYTLDVDGDDSADYTITWLVTDTFGYTATTVLPSGAISLSEFTSWLSVGDLVDPAPGLDGVASHTIVGDVPAAPTRLSASLTTTYAISVAFAKPSNPVASVAASSYLLERATVRGGTVGGYTQVGSVAADGAASMTDGPGTSGTYSYRVVARSPTGDSPPSAAVSTAFSTTPPASTAASIWDTDATGASGPNALLDLGDEIVVAFDRPVTVSSGWHIDVLDRDGTVGRLSAANATASLAGSVDQQLLLVMTTAPAITVAGSNIGVDIRGRSSHPALTGFLQVIAVSGVGNATGDWNLAKSGLAATYGNSRTLRDGTGDGVLTPPAPTGTFTAAVGSTELSLGGTVTGVDEGDTVTVFDAEGALLGVERAGAGGRTTVDLGSTSIAPGSVYYVVVTKPDLRRSHTATVTSSS